jgi:hypothetical protein
MLKIKNERIKEEVYFETLENGLKIYYYPKIGFSKKYAVFLQGMVHVTINLKLKEMMKL